MGNEQQPQPLEQNTTYTAPQPPLPPNENTPKSKRKVVIIVAIIVLVLAMVSGVGYTLLQKSKPQQGQSSGQQKVTQNNKTERLQPEDVTNKVKDTFASQYTLLDLDKNNEPKENEMSVRLSKGAPPYKTKGFTFYSDYDGGSILELMPHNPDPTNYNYPKAGDTAIRTEIADIYKEFGLDKTGTFGAKDVYTDKNLICTIETPSDASSSSTASCGRIDDYKGGAEKIKPFADVLPNVSESTILGGLEISNSRVSGYQTAKLGESRIEEDDGSDALFYKKEPGKWVYFTNTQAILSCSDYNTADLRSAYKGHPCLDKNYQNSTVQ